MTSITLFLAGDVMTGRGIDQILPHPSDPILFEPHIRDARDYVRLAEAKSGPIARNVAFEYVWGDALSELVRTEPHASIVNLETSITTSDDALPWKGIHYRMHPSNAPCLTAAKIDVCVLANNHVLDWGEAGLVETLEVLDRARIAVAGAGRTEQDAKRAAMVDLGHHARVVVLGLGHGSSGIPSSWAAEPTRPGVWLLDDDLAGPCVDAIGERIHQVKSAGDVVIASIHWGPNWGYQVPASHVRFAHALVDAGVDIVHGHSSHHPLPIEIYGQHLILYGCGDFISDYEGIEGYERYRGDLVLMYFVTVEVTTGALLGLRMVPLRTRKFRLERALPEETAWLANLVSSMVRPRGTRVDIDARGALVLART